MIHGINKAKTPEEKELGEKLAQLAELEADLAQKELELTTLATELQVLQGIYIRAVGRKFAELDALNAEIAELVASRSPADEGAVSAAQVAREQAQESAWEAGISGDPDGAEPFTPTKELQQLYRELAKKVHPDLAFSEEDRKRRNSIMAEVNKAYSEGDTERLIEILDEWRSSPEAIEGEDIGSRLVRTIRMIDRVRRRIDQIETELHSLVGTDPHDLKVRFDEAATLGRDLIQELVTSIDAQIERARSRLKELKAV